MAILVTGGAGFIGSNFIMEWLVHQNELVINLDKLTYAGNLDNLASILDDTRHIFIEEDINHSEVIERLLREYKVRAIVHFAAESHVDRSIKTPEHFIQTNIVGTYHLLETTRHYWQELNDKEREDFRFLYISTDEVYGSLEAQDAPFTEVHNYQPNSPYSATKAAGDHLLRAYQKTYGLPVLTTHCSNNYGPFQHREKLIPQSILNALSGLPLPIYGDGQQIRDWLYVADHCEALRCVLAQGIPGENYNIGGWNEQKNIDVVQRICFLLDDLLPRNDGASYTSQISYVQDRAGHDRRYAIDARKIAMNLGWRPKETFESGIQKTVQWYVIRYLNGPHLKSKHYFTELLTE